VNKTGSFCPADRRPRQQARARRKNRFCIAGAKIRKWTQGTGPSPLRMAMYPVSAKKILPGACLLTQFPVYLEVSVHPKFVWPMLNEEVRKIMSKNPPVAHPDDLLG